MKQTAFYLAEMPDGELVSHEGVNPRIYPPAASMAIDQIRWNSGGTEPVRILSIDPAT